MSATATFIVNPAAGHARLLQAELPRIESLLNEHDLALRVLTTSPQPGSARHLAECSLDSSLIVACGGDGTVHGVVQGMVSNNVPLGVLPLGTANALARNLHIPLDPFEAVRRLLSWQPQTIPLGEITTADARRAFIVMAGCGPDGALIHSLPAAAKARLGRVAYYTHAARLFCTRRWPSFNVRYRLHNGPTWRETTATAVMAARIPDLGGMFSGLTSTASLASPTLQVHLLGSPAQLSFPAWFACSRLRVPNPWLQTLEVEELECNSLASTPIYIQADAEPLGTLPMRLRLLPDALRLLMPASNLAPQR